MKEYSYVGIFAGTKLNFSFRHPETALYFRNFLAPSPMTENAIRIPISDCDCWMQDYGMADDGNTEFGMAVYRASDALLHENRCVIHAAAFLWHERAYLLAADSGVGKTTQIKNWMALYNTETRIINGDKPILRKECDGTVTVHPSPWKGKEEWGDDTLSAPLGGIIILQQGNKNTIQHLSPAYIVARLLSYCFSSFETSESIHALCQMEDAILRSTPVWRLVNKGDLASTRLIHDTLLRKEESDDGNTAAE